VINNEDLTDFAFPIQSRWTTPLRIDASAEVLDSDIPNWWTYPAASLHSLRVCLPSGLFAL
jgi:hypothetical protein